MRFFRRCVPTYRCINILFGLVMLVLRSSAATVLVFYPDEVKERLPYVPGWKLTMLTVIEVSGTFCALCLLFGLIFANRFCLNVFLIFVVALTAHLVISTLLHLLTQPTQFGWEGFFSSVAVNVFHYLMFFTVSKYRESIDRGPPNLLYTREGLNE